MKLFYQIITKNLLAAYSNQMNSDFRNKQTKNWNIEKSGNIRGSFDLYKHQNIIQLVWKIIKNVRAFVYYTKCY